MKDGLLFLALAARNRIVRTGPGAMARCMTLGARVVRSLFAIAWTEVRIRDRRRRDGESADGESQRRHSASTHLNLLVASAVGYWLRPAPIWAPRENRPANHPPRRTIQKRVYPLFVRSRVRRRSQDRALAPRKEGRARLSLAATGFLPRSAGLAFPSAGAGARQG